MKKDEIVVKNLLEWLDRRIEILNGWKSTGISDRISELNKVKDFITQRDKEVETSEIEKELKSFLSSKEYEEAKGDRCILVARHIAEWAQKRVENAKCLSCINKKGCPTCEDGSMWEGDPLPHVDEKKEKMVGEIDSMYGMMDKCVTHILNARVEHNEDAENRALVEMEGLMVSAMQLMTCMKEYLSEEGE